MMEGINNAWGMILGWITGLLVLVVFILPLVMALKKTINNNPK